MPEPLRILLIEDDEFARTVIRRTLDLSKLAARVISAGTLAEATKILGEGSFDCILLDFTLPDGNGFVFLDKQRENGSTQTPVVILTARDDQETALAAFRHGAEDYLVKGSFNADLLARAIRYAIERHRIKMELDRVNEQLERLVVLDPLTGLLNRRGLQEALPRELERSRRTGSHLIVALVDLDDFKTVNEDFGHAAGDVLLKEVGALLTEAVRGGDYVARIGGDEFMLLFPHTRLADGIQIAERVRLTLATASAGVAPAQTMKITASVGVVDATDVAPSVDALLSRSQSQMYTSKKLGKDRVTASNRDGQPEVGSDPAAILLDSLLGGDGFSIVMQPIVRLADGCIVGHELLARSRIPTFENPTDFFNVALKAKSLTAVDLACFERCLDTARRLPANHDCHVNLFPSTLIGTPAEHFVQLVSGLKTPRAFCIELSEQQIIGDPWHLVEAVQCLKEAGILVAIDDVGFGRSCLESLVLLEPDVVKIDRRLVTGIAADIGRRRSLRRLVNLLNSLEVEIVAEGVESADDIEPLLDLGVQYAQGYHFGRPDALARVVTEVAAGSGAAGG